MNTPKNRRSSAEGWRIERIPGCPPHPTDDGRFALPLWLVRDGRHVTDIELLMSPAEAEHLHAGLCRALDSHPAPADARCCRQPLGKSATPRL